jgi:hypothetical protein
MKNASLNISITQAKMELTSVTDMSVNSKATFHVFASYAKITLLMGTNKYCRQRNKQKLTVHIKSNTKFQLEQSKNI